MKTLKKILVIVAIITLFITISSFTGNAASCKLKAKTRATNVNVRKSANIKSKVIKNLKNKTNVTLLDTKLYNKKWYKIKLSTGKKGYISSQYLKISKNQVFIPKTKTGYAKYNGRISFVNTTSSKIKFTSSNKSVVKVTSDGVLKFQKKGKATITAKAGKVKSKSTVTVKNADVKITTTTKEMYLDEKLVVKATCVKGMSFKSSNKNVAKINNKGEVDPISDGVVTFTVKSRSGSDSIDVVIKKRSIKLVASKSTLYKGERSILTPSGGSEPYTYSSNNTNVITVDKNGIVTSVGVGTAKIICQSGELKKTKTFTVKKGSAVNISNDESDLNQGMTLYLKSSTSNVKWSSSDESIATVKNGYVTGVKKGIAIITAYTSKGANDCLVTVKSAQSVRFVYTSENSSLKNEKVTFYAITDTKRKYAKFVIKEPDETVTTLTSSKRVEEEGRYIYSCEKTLKKAGVYTFEVYTKTSNSAKWLTEASGIGTTFVNDADNYKTVSYAERRATTALIDVIAQNEGYASQVYLDTIANNIPTLGYGRVIYAGSTFYNGLTKKEAFAYLVKTVNESGYTSRVNKLLIDNKIKFNQQQFDALVDFSYNLGPYCITNNSDLLNVLLNSYGKSSYERKAYINCYDAVIVDKASDNAKVLEEVNIGKEIDLKGASSKWYKVELSDGMIAYILKTSVTRRTTDEKVRNLNNVKISTFAKNYLAYHHSTGICYKGLLNRRVDEVEMFFFNDYIRDGYLNKSGLSYKCSSNSKFYI